MQRSSIVFVLCAALGASLGHAASTAPGGFLQQHADDFDREKSCPASADGLGDDWEEFVLSAGIPQPCIGPGSPPGTGDRAMLSFDTAIKWDPSQGSTSPRGAYAEGFFQAPADDWHQNVDIEVRLSDDAAYAGKLDNEASTAFLEIRRNNQVITQATRNLTNPPPNDDDRVPGQDPPKYWLRVQVKDTCAGNPVVQVRLGWGGSNCTENGRLEDCTYHDEFASWTDPDTSLAGTTGTYAISIHHQDSELLQFRAGSARSGGCGGGGCPPVFEAEKASCGLDPGCNNAKVFDLVSCIASFTTSLFAGTQIFGAVGQGYPAAYVFPVENESAQPQTAFITILNGAEGAQRIDGGQIELNGVLVMDDVGEQGWADTAVVLPPGSSSVTVRNLTTVAGALTLLVTDEPLLP